MMIISISLALYILQSIFAIIPFDSLKDIMRYMPLSLVSACQYIYLKMSRCQFIIAAWCLFIAVTRQGKVHSQVEIICIHLEFLFELFDHRMYDGMKIFCFLLFFIIFYYILFKLEII